MPRGGRKHIKKTKVVKRALLLRHEGRCFYCDLLVEKDASPPHPRAPTIDHKRPISRGGSSDSANLALACNLCNLQKGNMTSVEFLLFRRYRMRGLDKHIARQLAGPAIEATVTQS